MSLSLYGVHCNELWILWKTLSTMELSWPWPWTTVSIHFSHHSHACLQLSKHTQRSGRQSSCRQQAIPHKLCLQYLCSKVAVCWSSGDCDGLFQNEGRMGIGTRRGPVKVGVFLFLIFCAFNELYFCLTLHIPKVKSLTHPSTACSGRKPQRSHGKLLASRQWEHSGMQTTY